MGQTFDMIQLYGGKRGVNDGRQRTDKKTNTRSFSI